MLTTYDGSINSFAALLEEGHIAEAFQLRLEAIEGAAQDYRQELEAAKVTSAALGVVGLVLSASPIVAVIAGCGLLGYGYVVCRDYQITKRLCPVPLLRKDTGDLLAGIGLAANNQGQDDDPLLNVLGYVAPDLGHEYELLMVAEGQLTGYLTNLPGDKRLCAYRHILRHTRLRNSLKLPSLQEVAAAIASQTQPQPKAIESEPVVNTESAAIEVEAEVILADGESPKAQEQTVSDRTQVTQPPPITQHLPLFDRTRIINESKGLMIIGDMGAAKTCVAQYIANGFDGYGIIVFDPHGMTDWGNAYVITKMGAIYEQMRILLALLENGDTTPLLIICDEWLEIRGDRRNKKGSEYAGLADDFIRLFSTKPRKFNKLAAFVLHSPNVEAAGVDSFLRENYLKVYLGRLAKKEFSHIQDCAYPCVLEDEQQEHPTHGHHTEFKPKGKAPRNLQPLNSAPIAIPLAYLKGFEVAVCDRGWDGQLRLEVENIRQRLELLLDSSTPEPNPEPSSSAVQDDEPLTRPLEPLNQPNDEACTNLGDGSRFSSEPGSERFTPLNLTREQVLLLLNQMRTVELNQTQIIESLWRVRKGGSAAWKEAYAQFKNLTGEG